MTRHFRSSLAKVLLLSAASLFLTGCEHAFDNPSAQQQADCQHYARRAYHEQQLLKDEMAMPPQLNEVSAEDLVLNLEGDILSPWRRKGHETVDQWLARLHRELLKNHEIILGLESDLESLEGTEEDQLSQLHGLIRKNEQLRTMLEQWSEPDESEAKIAGAEAMHGATAPEASSRLPMPAPSFTIHLVRPGETLWSIADHYYGDGKMSREIMLWNQGWIRNPYELLAGTGLILFPEGARQKKQQVVDTYLQKLEAQR